ncbi:MAG: hypothetical protein ABSG55_06865 [Dehalococcoidia bacterium]
MNKPASPSALALASPSLWRRVPIAWVQLGIVIAALGVWSLAKTVDPDFWWHLRTGKLILESGIPRHDPFSWTAAGKAWVTHEWLSEVIIYAVESTFGYLGNVLLFGTVVSGAMLVAYALGRRLGAGTKPLVLLMFPAVLVMVRFVAVRPQEFTWLLFAVFVYVLQRREEGDAMPLWVLPPLMALWVNLHLGFVYGLMAVAVWTLVQVARWLRSRGVGLRTPLLVAGGCLLATLFNPNGPAILIYPLHYLQGGSERSLILEWQRPDLTSVVNIPITLTLVLLAVSLPWQRRRPFLAILSLAAVALGVQAARNLPFAVLLLLPVAGSAAADHWRAASRAWDSGMTFRTLPGVALTGGLAVCLLAIAPSFGASLSGFRPSNDGYPSGGVSFIESNYSGARLFNDYGWGGYVIDRLYPNTPVFIDGREEFYGSKIFGDYIHVLRVDDGWDDLLSQYGVEVALIERDSKLAKAMRDAGDWQEEFSGPVESVFIRR